MGEDYAWLSARARMFYSDTAALVSFLAKVGVRAVEPRPCMNLLAGERQSLSVAGF